MSFIDQVQAVPVDIPDDPRPAPPRIYWFNGIKQARTPGIFHVKYTELGSEPGKPWVRSNRFDDEVGFEAKRLEIAVVAVKTQAFISERDGAREVRKTWLPKWQKGAQLYTEVLCFVEGIDGVVTWNCKGLTGKAFSTALRTYQTTLLRQAEAVASQKLPLWSFWLPFSSTTDDNGKIVYQDTGYGSFITPPALVLPDKPLNELVEHLFVGADVYAEGDRVRKEYAAWLRETHANKAVDDGEVVGADAGDAFAQVARRSHVRVDPASAAELGLSDEVEVPFS